MRTPPKLMRRARPVPVLTIRQTGDAVPPGRALVEDAIGASPTRPGMAAVGGSWPAPAAGVQAGQWGAITVRARRAMHRPGAPAEPQPR